MLTMMVMKNCYPIILVLLSTFFFLTKKYPFGDAALLSNRLVTPRDAAAARHLSHVGRRCTSRKTMTTIAFMAATQTPKENAVAATRTPLLISSSSSLLHHFAVKTRNITVAIQFYSLFGFEVETKFRSGPARAAWLAWKQQSNNTATSTRMELIEVPAHILNEKEGTRYRAFDLMKRQDLLGWNHVALDVTASIESKQQQQEEYQLKDWLQDLNVTSLSRFNKSLRVALEPRQQIIGRGVYELAFVYDADGALIELLHHQHDLPQEMDSGWEPWNGTGFISG